jgi:hypothetical protein
MASDGSIQSRIFFLDKQPDGEATADTDDGKRLRWSAAEDNQMNTEEQRRDKKRD